MTAMRSASAIAVRQVVRDIERGEAVFLVKGQDLLAHLQAIGRIDIAQRLVHQHDPRRSDHGAAERDALLLPAGKLGRLAIERNFLRCRFSKRAGAEIR